MRGLIRKVIGLPHRMRARFEARVDWISHNAMARVVTEHDPRPAMLEALNAYAKKAEAQADEVTLVLDAVVAEQFRLQSRIEELEAMLHEALGERTAVGVDRS